GAGRLAADAVDAEVAGAFTGLAAGRAQCFGPHAGVAHAGAAGDAVVVRRAHRLARRRAALVPAARPVRGRRAAARAVADPGRRVRRAAARLGRAGDPGGPLAAGARAVAHAVRAAAGRRLLRTFVVGIAARRDRTTEAV